MNIYGQAPLLSGSFEILGLVEDYKSFVWKERYTAFGDFEMVLDPSSKSLSFLSIGNELVHDESTRIMRIETRINRTSLEGEDEVVISGRSWESHLLERCLAPMRYGNAYYQSGGERTTLIGTIVARAFSTSTTQFYSPVNPADGLATFAASGGPYVPGEGPISIQLEPGPIYDIVVDLCAPFDMGFAVKKVVQPPTQHKYYFTTYFGADRTGVQSTNDRVSFGTDMGNLNSLEELTSQVDYYNVAYVFWGENFDMEIVLPAGVTATPVGLSRRALFVNARDIRVDDEVTLTQAKAAARQRGLSELAKRKEQRLVDGEVVNNGFFKYGENYGMGDIVELWNGSQISRKRVTEYIWTSDRGKGEQGYPTFSEILWEPAP